MTDYQDITDVPADEVKDVSREAPEPQLTLTYPQSQWQAILNELGKAPYADVAAFLPAMVANLSSQLKKPEEGV